LIRCLSRVRTSARRSDSRKVKRAEALPDLVSLELCQVDAIDARCAEPSPALAFPSSLPFSRSVRR